MTGSLRIVSLLSAATEMVCALGRAHQLVGISHECDYPPEILDRPVVTETKVDPQRPSADIDGQVRQLVGAGLSVYGIRTDVLRRLAPDVILTQQQCAVCAVSYDEVIAAVTSFLESAPVVVSLQPTRLGDILDDIRRVGEAIGAEAAAAELVGRLRRRMERVREAIARVSDRPRTLFLDWIEPLMAGGHWIPEMIQLAGGSAAFGRSGLPAPSITWEAIVESQPEVIVIAPCGFSLRRTERELSSLTGRPGWAQLPAVRMGRVYIADGVAYFNRSGPRIIDSLEMLAAMIHPEVGQSLLEPGVRASFTSLL
ncbi:MAG: cobalamin-binding protein [Acidobacteria bacterium]|nr:MAG: cobalamin-binding protein [Acidobacteriota bacterium]